MNSKLILPVSIIIAGIAIGGALAIEKAAENGKERAAEDALRSIRTINLDDHYLGNPKAPIVMIEYSDYDCAFCGGFFENMSRIMEEFGKDGKIVWVHRHMPLYQIHPSAKSKANAAECAAYEYDEDSFWKISEKFYELSQTGKTDTLENISSALGFNSDKFKKCLSSNEFSTKIDFQYQEAFSAGARGTPFTVIIKGEKRYAVAESLPYFELRSLVESLIEE